MSCRVIVVLLCLSIAPVFAGSKEAGTPDQAGSSVIVDVDGAGITLADFERDHPLALFQAKNAYYDAEKKAIDATMDDYLLGRQAKKENLAVPQLLDLHVNSQIAPDPSDEALKVYYEGLNTSDPFETLRDKILDHLREVRLGRAKLAYMQQLRKQANITVKLAAPRADLTTGNAPVRGAEQATLTLIEFADYECPYCQQSEPDLNKIEAEYKSTLAFAYKDFPLPTHTHAQKAAEAAQCAGVQNKYWEYHDFLLTSRQLEVPQLKAAAQAIGLNTGDFDKCLDSGVRAAAVKANFEEGLQLGISGTPSFLLNGRFISGSIPYEQLRQIIDEELKNSGSSSGLASVK